MNNNQDHKYIKSAKNTINTEIKGLNSLLSFFDESFIKAIDLILNSKGRVICSGMGKSGHIAGKMAATFASTGTPAFAIHPGEASHGDLGMVTKDDVVILLSNSGETKELKDIIYYCKRFDIDLIGMVRNPKSELVEASKAALVLPNIPEANKVNAPTTSTTMMLALGDAMATALMEAKGFNNEEYGVFHPGGKLGAQFIKVKDLMHTGNKVPLVSENKLMPEILNEMTSKSLGCTGVVNKEGKLVGIITDGDLRRHMSPDFMKLNASSIMTRNPLVVEQNTLAVAALKLMNSGSKTALFVVKDINNKDNQEVLGVLHLHDCLRAGI